MINSGLVSVTFRQLSTDSIIELVKKAGLAGIEWGGDIHVPHGDIQCAYDTRRKTEDAGLSIAAYGSYYRVGHNEPVPYKLILDTAVCLGAPIVRVWAGKMNAEDADAQYWQRVVIDAQEIAYLTATAGLKVAFEYYPNTLTNSLDSTLRLLEAVGHQAVTSYWQIPPVSSVEDNLIALDKLQFWLSNIHVYTEQNMPLGHPEAINHSVVWMQYLEKVASIGNNHYALIEFVRNDSPEQFLQDAVTLKSWLEAIH
jgi:3-dehydroshikimate dehydratase